MRPHRPIVLLCGLLLAANTHGEGAAGRELKSLRGTWTIVTHEEGGRPVATDRDATVAVAGDRFTTQAGAKVLRAGAVKLDPVRSPRHIDVSYNEGPFKGKTLLGVYTLEGGTWKICYALPGKERPAAVPNKAGQEQVLLVLERERR